MICLEQSVLHRDQFKFVESCPVHKPSDKKQINKVYPVLRCGAVEVYKRFGRVFCLHLQVRRIKDGGSRFLQNVGQLLPEYVVSYLTGELPSLALL